MQVRSSFRSPFRASALVTAPGRIRRPLSRRAIESEGFEPASLAGLLGYVAGTGFFSLWFIEQQARSSLESELQLARSKADDQTALAAKLEVELEREKQGTRDLAMFKRRLDEATKDNLKLERALELKVWPV